MTKKPPQSVGTTHLPTGKFEMQCARYVEGVYLLVEVRCMGCGARYITGRVEIITAIRRLHICKGLGKAAG